MSEFEFFAPCPRGLEGVCADELRTLGITRLRPLSSGVAFFTTFEKGMRAALWSRIASRILLVVARIPAADADELYAGARSVDWPARFAVGHTFAIDANGVNGKLRNTQFTGLKVKDAICDTFRDACGSRPDVDSRHADVRVNVSIHGEKATIALDLAGESLHRRAYRKGRMGVAAPLKEALAAGMLMLAGWPDMAREGATFIDPMCGSGTLAIEAAMMAGDIAPGILRGRWCFENWEDFDQAAWDALLDEADERAEAGRSALGTVLASDIDPSAIEVARGCVHRMRLDEAIDLQIADVADLTAPEAPAGLIAINPPYGERLSTRAQLPALYAALSSRLRAGFDGYTLAVITSDPDVDTGLCLTPERTVRLFNGPIESPLHIYRIGKGNTEYEKVSAEEGASAAVPGPSGGTAIDDVVGTHRVPEGTADEGVGRVPEEGARKDAVAGNVSEAAFCVTVGERRTAVANRGTEQFVARLSKVAKARRKWAKRNRISSYRIYDADLPDYALAIDRYDGAGPDEGRVWIQVSEYAAPSEIDPAKARSRLSDALAVMPTVLGVSEADIFCKVRRHARGGSQYAFEKDSTAVRGITTEDGLLFEIAPSERLDCGLFLDQRLTRELIFEKADDVRFLNLFAYTGTATVHAAAGGAFATTTVDLSQTYLDWTRRNMELNGFTGAEHEYVRADCRRWIDEQRSSHNRWDLIFVDPPTFSNSSKMGHRTFDVQRDHAELLIGVSRLLTHDGLALFSCNLKRFEPDTDKLSKAGVELTDITPQTIPEDFSRTPRVHHCYLVKRVQAG